MLFIHSNLQTMNRTLLPASAAAGHSARSQEQSAYVVLRVQHISDLVVILAEGSLEHQLPGRAVALHDDAALADQHARVKVRTDAHIAQRLLQR